MVIDFIRTLEEVSVNRFTTELYNSVKDNSSLFWFVRMVYPMVRDIPDLAILHYNFFCSDSFSMATFDKITHESQ